MPSSSSLLAALAALAAAAVPAAAVAKPHHPAMHRATTARHAADVAPVTTPGYGGSQSYVTVPTPVGFIGTPVIVPSVPSVTIDPNHPTVPSVGVPVVGVGLPQEYLSGTPVTINGNTVNTPPVGYQISTSVLPGTQFFTPTSIWNTVADYPYGPTYRNSSTINQALYSIIDQELATAQGPWINTGSYSVPVYTVDASVGAQSVNLDDPQPWLQSQLGAVPIPALAQPAAGNGRQLVVYRPSTGQMWELSGARRDATGHWHAAWGGYIANVRASDGVEPAPTGATGSGIPAVAGLITINELKAGVIKHALAIGIPNTAAGAYTWPATRTNGTTKWGGIPMGTHLRIAPSVNLASLHLSRIGLIIATAAQRYGMIVRDTSKVVTFFGEDPTPTGVNPYASLFGGSAPSQLLAGFPWHSVQALPVPGA